MPQPKRIEASADALANLYREAQERLIVRYGSILDSPRKPQQQARIRELLRAIDVELDALHRATSTWAASHLPAIYAAGATSAAKTLAVEFQWTALHRDAVQALAQQLWTDLLAETQHMAQTTKRALRDLARTATRASLLESQTPVGAARTMAEVAQQSGIFTVTYRNKAVHLVADYSEMAIRTTTATAYNTGTLTLSRDEGVEYMRCFDGSGCGLNSHDDAEKVNGRVYPIDVADSHPLSHPRCRRSWGPEPQIASAQQAKAAGERPAPFIPDAAPAAPSVPSPSGRTPRQPRMARASR